MKLITQFVPRHLKKTFKNKDCFIGITIASFFFMKRKMRSSSGFSIVEVLVAIGIIMIIAALSMPSLQGYIINRSLKSAARELISDVNESKERAISENREYRITLTENSPNYTILQCQNIGTTCAGFQNFQQKSLASFSNSILIDSTGTTVTQYDFQSRGTVNPGSIRLVNQRGSRANIVTNITGRVSVEFIMQ